MFFTYIVLSIWMYSLQRQKPEVVEVSPVVNTEVVKSKPKKVEATISEVDQINTWFEENDIADINNPEWENEEDFSNEELYEEIIFEDNFDKEYREDVGDDYFVEVEETWEINVPEEIEEE